MNEANTPPITLPATLVRRQGGDKGESKGVNKRTLHRVSWGLGRQDHTNHVFKDGYKGEGLEQHKGEDVGTQLRKEMKQKTRNDGVQEGMERFESPPAPGDKRERVAGEIQGGHTGMDPLQKTLLQLCKL